VVDVLEGGCKVRSDERPCTHVLWFFLSPDDLCIWIESQLRDDVVERERSELLDTNESDVFEVFFATNFEEFVVDLSRTEDDLLDLMRRVDVLVHFGDDVDDAKMISGIIEIFERRKRGTKKTLGTHQLLLLLSDPSNITLLKKKL